MDLRGDCYWCGHQNIASRCHLELENKKGSLLFVLLQVSKNYETLSGHMAHSRKMCCRVNCSYFIDVIFMVAIPGLSQARPCNGPVLQLFLYV